ncbi:TetR family transcriptional regulator [Terriglobus sp.]|uniref:TetR/AcrR family transcriptional regulator n=1 Tax=Terriglobus sp. TaxID=1889013 RepID=UPI003B00D3E4
MTRATRAAVEQVVPAPARKSDETRRRILNAALEIFRERGLEAATMREVATAAGVAVGAAYYYFPAKDAIVLAFYEEAQHVMRPALEAVLARKASLEATLRGIIQTKLNTFADNRQLMSALASHVDPKKPLSPFSAETAHIRESDLHFFQQAVMQTKLKLPKNIAPYVPRLLWLYQMGVLLFWVYDESPEQHRTAVLLDRTLKMLTVGLRLAALPLLRPLHRLAGDLLEVVYGD